MPRVTFIKTDGEATTIDAPVGRTLIDAATREMIPGLPGECGGGLACGTCHISVDPQWIARLPAADEMELEMIEAIGGCAQTSRLACQIGMVEALDGLVVSVPPLA